MSEPPALLAFFLAALAPFCVWESWCVPVHAQLVQTGKGVGRSNAGQWGGQPPRWRRAAAANAGVCKRCVLTGSRVWTEKQRGACTWLAGGVHAWWGACVCVCGGGKGGRVLAVLGCVTTHTGGDEKPDLGGNPVPIANVGGSSRGHGLGGKLGMKLTRQLAAWPRVRGPMKKGCGAAGEAGGRTGRQQRRGRQHL